MKQIKLLFLLVLFTVTNFAQTPQPAKEPTPAPRTISDISDSEFEDVAMSISGSFAERKVTGKVVGVHDGDTATVLDANKMQYKFRFNGIDAPELKMDFGNKAKQNLSDWIFGKEVTVVYSKEDKYGRYVGTIFVNGVDVNLEQIKAGFAWHYKKYSGEQSEKDRIAYADAEVKAREAKKGLWSQPNQTAPWDYRAQLKVRQAENRANREYMVGAKGGCYYLNSSGNKSYVDKKFCDGVAPTKTETKAKETKTEKSETKTEAKAETLKTETVDTKPAEPKPADTQPAESTTTEPTKKSDSKDRIYIKGSRGGCYYMNGDKKVYVKDKSLCGI